MPFRQIKYYYFKSLYKAWGDSDDFIPFRGFSVLSQCHRHYSFYSLLDIVPLRLTLLLLQPQSFHAQGRPWSVLERKLKTDVSDRIHPSWLQQRLCSYPPWWRPARCRWCRCSLEELACLYKYPSQREMQHAHFLKLYHVFGMTRQTPIPAFAGLCKTLLF